LSTYQRMRKKLLANDSSFDGMVSALLIEIITLTLKT
jgi:hypothetical protein